VPVPRVRIPAPPVTGVPGRVLWWGGLATVAAVGVLDWPVAAAIAAGTYVAERRARAGREGTAPPGPQGSPGGTHEGSD
jgi:hypothetical protein